MKTRAIITISCLSILFLSCGCGIGPTTFDLERQRLNHRIEQVGRRTRRNKARGDLTKSQYKLCRERESKILNDFTDEQLDTYARCENALGDNSEGHLKLAMDHLTEILPESTLLVVLDILAEKGRILREMAAVEREWESIEANLRWTTQGIRDVRLREKMHRRESKENEE